MNKDKMALRLLRILEDHKVAEILDLSIDDVRGELDLVDIDIVIYLTLERNWNDYEIAKTAKYDLEFVQTVRSEIKCQVCSRTYLQVDGDIRMYDNGMFCADCARLLVWNK